MLKNSILICIVAAGVSVLYADLESVQVPTGMLHFPSTDVGRLGKVEYELTAPGFDSVFVTLEILPAAGGAALELDEVSGDVGVINPICTPDGSHTRSIFFRYSGDPGDADYVAKVTVEALVSEAMAYANEKVASMSFAEKVELLGGIGEFENGTAGGIPSIFMADGPHGVRGDNATLFPCNSGLAATWDTSLAFEQGVAKAREFRAQGNNCSLGPALNLVYHCQLGRAFEYYSEDPHLSGKMAASDTRGLQSLGVIATVKHYLGNNREDNRYSMSAKIPERSLHEMYIYNFKKPIVEGHALGVMGAYNKVNGSFACSNKLLMTDVLRNEMGFVGVAMTDWYAFTDNFQDAALWGVDIKMPDRADYTAGNFQNVGDSIATMHARRIIYSLKRIGALEDGYSVTAYANSLLSEEHRTVARKVGTGGIVLAKNDGNVLPLPKTGKKIAITGPFAEQCRTGGGGSSVVTPVVRINPKQGITELLQGVGAGASTIVTSLSEADYIVVFVGVTGEGEGADRPQLFADQGNSDVEAALAANPEKTVVVMTGGSGCTPAAWSDAPAVLIALYPGQEQGYCIADVLFGNANPSGKLPVSFPASTAELPDYALYNNELLYELPPESHGYFKANKLGLKSLFPFGHGLSYTTFEYSNLRVDPSTIKAGDRVVVQVDVTNTGDVAGKEVVQLYLTQPTGNGIDSRVQDLRGFTKLAIDPGETETATFFLTREEMQYYETGGEDYDGDGEWRMQTGTYNLRVGTSSDRDRQPSMVGYFVVE
jgi:beta-glucosidase